MLPLPPFPCRSTLARMRLPDYLGVLGALVVGGVLTIVLLAGSLGTAPALPTRPPVSIPPLPTPTSNESLPSALPSGTPISGSLAIGQVAPELKVTLTDGSLMDTADFAGLPIWVNFMATWCPQCSTELPMMERFQGQLKDQMTILVVDVGEDRATVKDFLNGLNVDLAVGVDPDGSAQRACGRGLGSGRCGHLGVPSPQPCRRPTVRRPTPSGT